VLPAAAAPLPALRPTQQHQQRQQPPPLLPLPGCLATAASLLLPRHCCQLPRPLLPLLLLFVSPAAGSLTPLLPWQPPQQQQKQPPPLLLLLQLPALLLGPLMCCLRCRAYPQVHSAPLLL
jgi:hypothetical protein